MTGENGVKRTTVLIVDDSRIFRAAMEKALEEAVDVAIVGSVRNGLKAIEFMENAAPDLVTLDLEMPEMDGLETLARIQDFNRRRTDGRRTEVIMVSAATNRGAEITIEALERGAMDFVAKPAARDARESVAELRDQMLPRLRSFAEGGAKISKGSPSVAPRRVQKPREAGPAIHESAFEAVCIGVSTGGPKALATVLPELTQRVDLPIFIVQHMPPRFTESLAKSLSLKCPVPVTEAKDGDVPHRGRVYVAPGGRHMVVRKNREGSVSIGLNDQLPENGCRPSVDVLFRAAAAVFGPAMLAVVLTGMGSDGTKGLAPAKRAGAYVIAQDKESSVVWGMPGSAVEAGFVDDVVTLGNIPAAVQAAIRKREPR